MAGDDLFEILAEVFVKGNRRVSQLRFAEDFCNGPSAAMFSSEHSNRPVILLNHDLNALLHFGERGMKIASHFGFAHVDSSHGLQYGAFTSSAPTEYGERLDGGDVFERSTLRIVAVKAHNVFNRGRRLSPDQSALSEALA